MRRSIVIGEGGGQCMSKSEYVEEDVVEYAEQDVVEYVRRYMS